MVPRGSKLCLGGLILYLSMPIDLVPDFVPIAGQLDDAIIAALVFETRAVPGGGGPNPAALARPSAVA